jgi:hypothetical protein
MTFIFWIKKSVVTMYTKMIKMNQGASMLPSNLFRE